MNNLFPVDDHTCDQWILIRRHCIGNIIEHFLSLGDSRANSIPGQTVHKTQSQAVTPPTDRCGVRCAVGQAEG